MVENSVTITVREDTQNVQRSEVENIFSENINRKLPHVIQALLEYFTKDYTCYNYKVFHQQPTDFHLFIRSGSYNPIKLDSPVSLDNYPNPLEIILVLKEDVEWERIKDAKYYVELANNNSGSFGGWMQDDTAGMQSVYFELGGDKRYEELRVKYENN